MRIRAKGTARRAQVVEAKQRSGGIELLSRSCRTDRNTHCVIAAYSALTAIVLLAATTDAHGEMDCEGAEAEIRRIALRHTPDSWRTMHLRCHRGATAMSEALKVAQRYAEMVADQESPLHQCGPGTVQSIKVLSSIALEGIPYTIDHCATAW